MQKALKILVHVAAATFGSLAIIFAVASWRLSSGPISIAFLSPYIEAAFEAEDLSYRLEFDDTILTWAGWNRSLDILITEARFVGPDGEILASVPKISLGLSARSLLQGRIAPTSVELLRPEVHLVRTLEGKLEFAFGGEFEEPDGAATDFMADFLKAPGSDHPLGQLKRISILSAALRVDDALLGLSWSAPEADLIFDLYDDKIDGELLADIEVSDVALRVVAASTFERATGQVHTNFQFAEVVPAKLAGISPKLEALRALRLPVSGMLEFELSREGALVGRINFDLTGGPGSLDMPDLIPVPPNIVSMRLRGNSDVAFDHLHIETLFVDTGGPTFSFNGEISGAPGQSAIHGDFEFKEMPFNDLDNYWPDSLMVNARHWILGNVFDGVIANFTAHLDFKPGELELIEENGLRPDALDVAFTIRDATVNYFPQQPFAYGVDGEGHLDGASMTLNMRDGTIEEMYAPTAVALIRDLMQDTATLTIIVNIEGPADNAIRLLDGPRLGFPSKMGLSDKQFSGHVTAEMGVQFPFRSYVTFEEVQFAAIARLEDLTVRDLFGGYDLEAENLRLTLDENNLEVGGSVSLAGMPATIKWIENFSPQAPFQSRYEVSSVLDAPAREKFGIDVGSYAQGPFDMNLTYTVSPDGTQHIAAALGAENVLMEIPELFWRKPAGEEASILVLARLEDRKNVEITNFELHSNDLRVKGRATIGPEHGELISADLDSVQFGDNDLTVSFRRDGENSMVLDVTGKSLDLRPYIDQLLDSDQGNLPPFILEANVDRLITRADQQITDARARVVNTAERLESAFLSGTLVSGSELRLVLEPDGAKRRLTVRSDDAGSVARAFNIYDNAVGGSLLLEATLHDDEPGAPVSGEVRIENYKLINAPTLAQILLVASFTGIFDALQGEGITFSTFHLPFSLKGGIVTVENAQTAGFSIGLNASGKVNLENDKIDMRGTIVPFYAVNSLLGNIPLIGDLLVGGKGEGIFAATFSLTGTTEEPKVVVNPLAVLTPGFLRNLFSIFDGESNIGDDSGAPVDVPPPAPTQR
jgi:hypothetical protein